jgi:hypothetical protein
MTDPCTPGQGLPEEEEVEVRDRDPADDSDDLPEEETDPGSEETSPRVYDASPEPIDELEDLKEGEALNYNFSAGKNKWIANPGLLLGKSTDFTVPLLPLMQDPRVSDAYPADVPKEIEGGTAGTRSDDTFRHITGKQWMNLYHAGGPPGGRIRFFDQRRDGDKGLFSYHNPTNQLFGGPNARLGMSSVGDRFNGRVFDADRWQNFQLAMEIFSRKNELGLPIYFDSFRINFDDATANPAPPPRFSRRSHWNWRDYMYGLPGSTITTSLIDQYRRDGWPEDSTENSEWNNWGSAHYSRNLFPVIPFYGPNQSFPIETPEDAYSNETMRPPTRGYRIYNDHVTNIPGFLTKNELELLDIPGSAFYDINGIYNFYDCVYEDLISPAYNEDLLPNFYKFRPENYRSIEEAASGENPEEVIRNQIQALRADLLADDLIPAVRRILQRQLEIYTRDAVSAYGILDPRIFGEVKANDIYVNPEAEEFKRVYKERRLFPMYTEIEFATHHKSLLADAFAMGDHSSFMGKILLPFARLQEGDPVMTLDPRRDTPMSLVRDLKMELVSQYLATGTEEEEYLNPRTESSPSDTVEQDLKVMDLNDWLRWVESQEDNRQEDEAADAPPQSPQEIFREIMTSLILKSRIKQVITQQYRRRFINVLNGMPAHSETLAYRVEKKVDGIPVQNFYFGTNDKADLIKYVDSQVEYGKRYSYKMYQVVVIVGTQYCYLDSMTENAVRQFYRDSLEARPSKMFFGVMHKPSVKVVEVPMQEQEITILDRPPVAPDVNVIPFKGNSRRVLFNLNSGIGEVFAPPILLENDDAEQFENIAKNQKARFSPDMVQDSDTPVHPDDLIQFRNDDQTKIFEIFRLDKEPESWNDFFDKKIGRVESEATSASFVDQVTSNKKYYYIFRSEDTHGHVSNPTNIYQVEMVKDGEMTFMKMEIFKFKKKAKTSSLSFKNRIRISPAFLQKIIELPENGTFSDWEEEQKVGNSDNPVWGKKFKFRITSKLTGKQIDLNFKFVKKYARISEEVQNTVFNSDKC